MPQVPGAPYEPYPTVEPAERVLRPGGIPSVPDAYGVGVARAISTFGGDVEKAGKDVFDAALDLRKKQVETFARDATNDFYNNNISPAQEAFQTAKGDKANPDALHTSLTNLDTDRRVAAAEVERKYGLYARTLFDADTASMQRTAQREMTAHANKETELTRRASLDAKAGTKIDLIGNSQDTQQFDSFVTRDATGQSGASRLASEMAESNGFGPDWAARTEGQLVSTAVVAQANALAKVGRYQEARAFIEAHRNQILGAEHQGAAETAVNNSEDKFLAHDIARASAQGWPPYMTQPEIARSNGVATPLLDMIKRAQANHPELEMTIGDKGGRRTEAEQAALVRAGRSQTMQSGHLDGTAVDVVGRVNGRPAYDDLTLQKKVDSAVREAADQLGIDLRPQISWDKYHFQLGKDYNVAGYTKQPLPTLQEQRDGNVAYAQKASPNNPGLQDAVVSHTDEQWRIKRQSETAQFDDARQVFETNLAAGQYRTAADVPPELVRQMQTSNPAGAAFAANIGRTIRSYWDNDDTWTAAREANEHQMVGMLRSPDQTVQAQASRMDLSGVDLQSSVRKDLVKLQSKVRSGKLPDPTNLASVMSTLNPILLANNIDRTMPDQKTQDKYYRIQGQVYQRLEDMVSRQEAIPTNPVKIQELFADILRNESLTKDLRATAPQPVALPTITTKTAFDALAPGTSFLAINPATGQQQQYTKPSVPPAYQPGGGPGG